jgi:hypothetical protein
MFSAHTQSTRRTVEFANGESYSLTDSRLPVLLAAGRTPWQVRIAGGYATYSERSYLVTRRDSIVLRGETEAFIDEHSSDGSIGDIRLALAGRPTRRVAVGGALHLLTGSTQEDVRRRWDDSVTYRNTFELEDVQYGGFGASLSTMVDVSRSVRVAGWLRFDTRLNSRARGASADTSDLPVRASGAVEWWPRPALRFAAAVRWAGWSVASDGHDTFGWSVGAETGSAVFLIRVGVRRDQMAPGPGSEVPSEFGITAGLGRRFADDRARSSSRSSACSAGTWLTSSGRSASAWWYSPSDEGLLHTFGCKTNQYDTEIVRQASPTTARRLRTTRPTPISPCWNSAPSRRRARPCCARCPTSTRARVETVVRPRRRRG